MKVASQAFPQGKMPPTASKVHQQLQQHLKNFPFPEPVIRKYEAGDIEQLKLLQRQWFPLNYSQQFYVKILEGAAQCFVAEIILRTDAAEKPVRAVAGAIVFQVTSETDHLVDNWLNRMLSWKNNSIYIMTLGVIDELRNKGLAKQLLKQVYGFSENDPSIQIVCLHVVEYNKRAINFYKKNGFQLLERIEDHYHIMGKEYGGLKLGYFVNGGKRREAWGPWLKRIFLRKTTQDNWPQ